MQTKKYNILLQTFGTFSGLKPGKFCSVFARTGYFRTILLPKRSHGEVKRREAKEKLDMKKKLKDVKAMAKGDARALRSSPRRFRSHLLSFTFR